MPDEKYEITDPVLEVLEQGREREGLTDAQLYKRAGVSKQLYWQIKKKVNKTSSKIADLLRAVNEPVDIAEKWRSPMERDIIMALRRTQREAPAHTPDIVKAFKQMTEGAIQEERRAKREAEGPEAEEIGEEDRPDAT